MTSFKPPFDGIITLVIKKRGETMVMLITDRKQISFCFDGSEGERVNKCMKVQNFLRFGGGMLKHMNVLMSGLICQIQRHKPCLHTEVLSHVKSRQQGCAVTKKTKKGIE
jgi:hypothetical protein